MIEQQCLGTTRSGERCRIRTNLIDGYCRLHRSQAAATENPPLPPDPPELRSAPPLPEPEPNPPESTVTTREKNAPLLIAAFLILFIMLAAGMRRAFCRRSVD